MPNESGWVARWQRPWVGLAIAVVVVLLDQWTKQIALEQLSYRYPVPVTSWFDWMLTYNTGAAFSFLADAGGWQRYFLSGIASLVSVFIVVWLWRLAPADRVLTVPLGLILGGGVGNLIDRVAQGHVVDFISLHYGEWYWPAFNLADAAITAGASCWVIIMLMGSASPIEKPPVS